MCTALRDARELRKCQAGKKICEDEKEEAFKALANAINLNGEQERALQAAYKRVDELTYRLEPDFEVGDAPVLGQAWVRATLANNLPNYPGGVSWWVMDSEYRAATDEEIINFILWDDTNFWQWVSELRDCDKGALYFAGRFRMLLGRNNCFFTVDWSGGHAYNIFLRRSGGMWIYEWQNDRWWVSGEHGFQMPYPLQHVGLVG